MTENNIPKHWKIVKLKSISDNIQYGYTESSTKEKIGPKFLRITDIQDNKVEWNDVPYCKINSEIKSKYLLKDGDLVFARTGATVGKSFLIKGEIPEAVFASYLIRVRVNHKIDEKYLSYFFQSPNYWNQITEGQVGIGQPNVNGTKLGQLNITIAPFEEQLTIVSKIEELLSNLENGKQQLLTAQQQLKVYRQSLLKAAFEGRLTNKDVKEGELLEGWKWVKLSEVSKVTGGLTKNSKRENLTFKVPFLRVANVYFNRLELENIHTIGIKEVEFKRVELKKDDLLFVEGNGSIDQIGRVALWTGDIENCVHQNHLIKARFSEDIVAKYPLHFFCSTSGRDKIKEQASSTSGLHTLNITKISNLELPLPTIKEQQQIVDILESKLTVCDKIEETIREALLKSESLRQSILTKAFSGQLI